MCIRGVLLILLVYLCAPRITCFHVKYHETDDEALILKQQQGSKFTIEDLLTTTFPKKTSNDQDLDICKAGAFLGDIAIPEKSIDKEVISQLKKEVREGLQVEEEGLTDAVRIKLKLHVGYEQSTPSPHSNEPIETKPFDVKSVKNVKNGITLNKHSSTNNQKIDTVESKQKIINDTTDGVPSKNDKLIEYNPNSTSYGDILKVTDELVTSNNDEVAAETTTDQPEDTTKRRRHRRRRRRYRKKKSKQHRERGSSDVRKANEKKTGEGGDLASGQTLEHSSSNKQPSKRSVDELYTTHIKDENIVTAVTKLPNNYKSDNNNNIDGEEEETRQNFERQEQVHFVVADGKNPSSHQQLADSESSPKRHRRGSSRRRTIRAATARKERVWDFGVIPYEIDGNFSGAHKALFKQAMRHWENFTCVKFVERVPEEHPHYIVFTERPCGCCSFVGKRGNGAQAISIGKNCDKFGIVVHELGHVVGFWHEHTRPDRDQHVQIYRDHIMSGQEYNFNKLTDEEVNSLGLPYDYDSIMHYARNTFSKGTYLDTIAPHEKQIRGKKVPEIGQRLRLSAGDIAQTNLLYKCYKCGRTFQENSGAFTSPSYPVPSKEPERCEWRITATHGERIVLNITELDIYKSPNCGSDYIEIRDGYWHKSPVLGRFCGSGRLNEPIVSVGSRMLVTFITSPRQNGYRGFQASYEAVCGGVYQVTGGGHLESPNYPEDYKRNKECIWKLIVPPDYTVALRFQSFEIENHDNCVYDYVEVIDGFEPNSPVLGRFCGYKAPPDIKSKSNQLLVKFFSDSSVQKAGFSATFMKEYNECDHYDHGCEHYCINTLGSYECSCRIGFELHSDGKSCEAACGGIYDIPNGTITSPSFPDMYPGNKNCQWEIIAPPQYRITLNFTHFELEGNNLYHQECEYDSVVVESKIGDEIIRKHGTFCGSKKPELITSEGNVLKVSFNSDFTVHKTGFAAIFFTDMDECAIDNGGCEHECINTVGSYRCSCHNGFVLHENQHMCKEGGCKYEVTSPYGEIQSPNYPDYYPSRKDCVWHFTTTPGHRIKLIFNKFEMEPHQECAYDHVVFYDGDSPDSRILGRYCGSKVPHPIIASTNQMFMVFKSDASVQRKGFKAMHSTACGGHLLATDTVKHIYSHSRYGDYNYDNRADCDWSIEAAPGKNVHLTFLTFELEDEINCNYDYVEVFSGLDSSGPLYGRFCGNQNPTDIISDNEALLLRFKSDDTIVSKGFSASYVAIDQYDELGFEALKHTKPSSDEYYGEEKTYKG